MAEDRTDFINSYMENMEEAFIEDALKRMTVTIESIELLLDGKGDATKLNQTISHHAHNLKGTCETFGFFGLSVLSIDMYRYINNNKSSQNTDAYHRNLKVYADLVMDNINTPASKDATLAKEALQGIILI